ncbi:ABC transporter substrate-binding protein [Rhodopirellula sp. JC639]|uniref:ABC transporter substrate-binding protein n=1 Tax=Stieleria mannarensis TaxID=2755585 RepID=UPI0016026B08|nr:ABC transporter substrate-binding protein [Rhodopirellula sp. JC639]
MKPLHLSYLVILAILAGCGSTPPPSADEGTPVQVQLNWYPESEHGGLFQALADGSYESANFAVTIQPGGRATPIGPELALERAQFAIANADDVILYRQQGIDVVAVMAAMQNHPRCILARKDSGVESFEDLQGKTLQRQAGRAFVEFMRSKGILDGVKEVPYHGSIASLVGDPNIVIQAYSCAEPLLAQQQGVPVNTLMVSDLGFNPYSSVLVTTGKLIREQPDLVRRFVAVTRQGWRDYLTDGSQGNAAILKVNQEGMTEEALTFGAEVMRDLAMPGDASVESVGTMTAKRWSELFDQLRSLDLVDAEEVRVEDCYTLEFLE